MEFYETRRWKQLLHACDNEKMVQVFRKAFGRRSIPKELAIRIEPNDATAHYNFGIIYDKLGRYDEAVEAFKEAIRIKPDLAGAHCGLGVAHGALGHYTEAVEALKEAIRIKPDDAETRSNLGATYDKRGVNGGVKVQRLAGAE